MKYQLLGFRPVNLKNGQKAYVCDLGKLQNGIHGLKVVTDIWIYENMIELNDGDVGKQFEMSFNEKGRLIEVKR